MDDVWGQTVDTLCFFKYLLFRANTFFYVFLVPFFRIFQSASVSHNPWNFP